MDLVDDVAAHPYLGDRVALTGGTALAMFVLDAPRLSFDLDLNYIGAVDPDAMKADRPRFEAEMQALFATHGLKLKHRPRPKKNRPGRETATDHAGGKWVLQYRTAWGRSDGISVDVNYVRRVPLWPTVHRDSYRLGRWQATGVPVADVHEIAAGKLRAFYDRALPRDLFDVGLIPRIPGLDPARLRTAFVVYGAAAPHDWRPWGQPPPHLGASKLANQIRPALRVDEARRIRPRFADAYLDELRARAVPAQQMVLPLAPHEQAFVDLVVDHGRVEPDFLTADPGLQARIAAEPWLKWKTHNVRDYQAAVPQQRDVVTVEGSAAQPADQPHLEVRAADDAWGWEVVLQQPGGGKPLTGGPGYMSTEEALEASQFARALLDTRDPPRFEQWSHGWEQREPTPGDHRSQMLPVPRVGGWVLQVTRHDGGRLAASPLYPTQRAAHSAQRFLEGVLDVLDAPEARRPIQVRATSGCACLPRGRVCRHYHHQAPAANPISVSLRPHRKATHGKATHGWELVIRGVDGSPLRLSDPYPDEEKATGAHDFARRIVNGPHPIRFEGWNPSMRPAEPGYAQPTPEEAAATVRVCPPPEKAPHAWRLQATRPGGSVILTSLPYPTGQAATEAMAFVGALTAHTGDPARTGWVRDTTQPADRTCDCQSLGAECLHYKTVDPDDRSPDRGLSLGF